MIILGDVKENHLDVSSPNNLKEDTGSLMVLCRASASTRAYDSTNPRAYDSIPNRNSQNVNHAVVNEGVQLKEINNLTEAVGEISMFFVYHIYVIVKKVFLNIFYFFNSRWSGNDGIVK